MYTFPFYEYKEDISKQNAKALRVLAEKLIKILFRYQSDFIYGWAHMVSELHQIVWITSVLWKDEKHMLLWLLFVIVAMATGQCPFPS